MILFACWLFFHDVAGFFGFCCCVILLNKYFVFPYTGTRIRRIYILVSIVWAESGWTHLGALKSDAKAKNAENFESVCALLLLLLYSLQLRLI
jgi:hypothetical protein